MDVLESIAEIRDIQEPAIHYSKLYFNFLEMKAEHKIIYLKNTVKSINWLHTLFRF